MAFPCLPITAKGRRGDHGAAVALTAAAGAIHQIVLPTSSATSMPPVRSTAITATNSVSAVFGIRDACVSRLTPQTDWSGGMSLGNYTPLLSTALSVFPAFG